MVPRSVDLDMQNRPHIVIARSQLVYCAGYFQPGISRAHTPLGNRQILGFINQFPFPLQTPQVMMNRSGLAGDGGLGSIGCPGA